LVWLVRAGGEGARADRLEDELLADGAARLLLPAERLPEHDVDRVIARERGHDRGLPDAQLAQAVGRGLVVGIPRQRLVERLHGVPPAVRQEEDLAQVVVVLRAMVLGFDGPPAELL